MKVLGLAGSYRTDSTNKMLLNIIQQSGDFELNVTSLADFDVPLYNGDLEKSDGIPEGAAKFRDALGAADALIIASPEYNYSYPGTLKNLIDWTSRFRPFPFQGVPTLLVSTSPGMVGGNRGLLQLRTPLAYLGANLYPSMFSLGKFGETVVDGEIAVDALSTQLEKLLADFAIFSGKLGA